jgi:myo-inositol 2-dehydrogenase / D-chiro-inositol 1-dehydrogenase
MRIAVIGTGRIGEMHARLLATQPTVESVILHDADPERAAACARAVGGIVARDTDEAMDRAQAVVVAASTDAHPGLVRAAVDRGLPVFCEKPLALDLDTSAELVRHIEAVGGVVQVGFQRRFDPGYMAARERIASGAVGTVYLVRLMAHDHLPPPDAYVAISGGLFRDSSIHDFDALRWVTGSEVAELYAAGAVRNFPVFEANDDVDTAVVSMRLTDGTLATLSQTRHDPLGYDIRMEIVGSRDSVSIGLGPRTPLHLLDPGARVEEAPPWDGFISRFETAYRAELLAFLQLVRGEMPSPCTAREAHAAIALAVAATRSRHEQRVIVAQELRAIGAIG